MDWITLNNGVKMPLEGFGVFQIPDPAQCEGAVLDALAAGCRLIDTAAAYMDEQAVGAALERTMAGTASRAASRESKGQSRLTLTGGRGRSRRVAWVMTARVPSLPTIRSLIE